MTTRVIDLDLIKEVSYKGVRRTAAFMGLGLNASQNESFCEYQLTNITQIQLLSDNLDEVSINHLKKEFGKWIIINGIRELIETFSVFLDSIHNVYCLIDIKKKRISKNDYQKIQSSFNWKGLAKKLGHFEEKYSVNSSYKKHLISINNTRNCLSHRRGIVGSEDLGEYEQFKVSWMGLDIFIETNDGKIISLEPPIPDGGIFVEKGGSIKIKQVERNRSFSLGEELKFNARELSEMCMLMLWASDDLIDLTMKYSKVQGITINVKK